MHPKLVSTRVSTAEELLDLITRSLSHRRTSETARNAQSSRSHAVLTIRVKNLAMPLRDDGELILVEYVLAFPLGRRVTKNIQLGWQREI